MKNHKKLSIFLVIIILLAFSAIMPFVINAIKYKDKTKIYEERWNIDLPSYDNVVYKAQKKAVWQDPQNYIIFKLKETPENFLDDFYKEKNEHFEKSIQQFLELSNSSLIIENEYIPNLNKIYFWKSLKDDYEHLLLMIYFPDTLELILCETI